SPIPKRCSIACHQVKGNPRPQVRSSRRLNRSEGLVMSLRFKLDYNDPHIAWEPLVDEVFGELTSSFLEMPKGEGFIDYPTFEKGYQRLKRSTDAFVNLTPETVLAAVREVPMAFIVFRCILGFTPPEWAYVTTEM